MKTKLIMTAGVLLISTCITAQNPAQTQSRTQKQDQTGTQAQTRTQTMEQAGTQTREQYKNYGQMTREQKQARNAERKALKKQQREMKKQEALQKREQSMEKGKPAARNSGARPAGPRPDVRKAPKGPGAGRK